jgi:hypothetical protein
MQTILDTGYHKTMKYSRWDELILKVEDQFGYRDKINAYLKVTVIGFDPDCEGDYAQYMCYIPPYERIPFGFQTFTCNKQHIKAFEIDPKFLGDTVCLITSKTPTVKHLPAPKGEKCDRCKEFHIGAVRNNDAFLCRQCRQNPYR